MAIEAASGTYYGGHDPNSSATTGSFDITVPSDADCLIVFVSTYTSVGSGLTSGGYGVTAEGNSPSHEKGADASVSYYQGAGWVFLNPPTGSGVTIAWSFGGPFDQHQFAWIAYKGVGSVRGSESEQDNNVLSRTLTFTASSNDLIVVGMHQYPNGVSSATWTNATKIADYFDGIHSLLSIASKAAAGNTTISATYTGGFADGGMTGLVLIPSATPSSLILPPSAAKFSHFLVR